MDSSVQHAGAKLVPASTKECINTLCKQICEEQDEATILILVTQLRSELSMFVEKLRSELISHLPEVH